MDTQVHTGEMLETLNLIEDAQFFLDNSPTLSQRYQAALNAVIEYLKVPTGNMADIKRHSLALGTVWLENKHIQVVSNLNRRFIELQYAYQNAALQASLKTDPQQMMDIAAVLTELQGLSSRSSLQKDNPLKRDYDGFLDKNEMRLRDGTVIPLLTTTDSTLVKDDDEKFLETGQQDPAIDRALAYLKAPTSSPMDLKKIGDDIGELIGIKYMGDGPPEIEALNTHILRLQFEHELAILRAAMERQPQHMKEVAASMVLTRNLAMSSKTTDSTQLLELEAFLKNVEIREKKASVV